VNGSGWQIGVITRRKGRKLDFMEAFPDEGDIDMAQALAAYRDVGYPDMVMPDHVPQIGGRDPLRRRLRLLLRLHSRAARCAGPAAVTGGVLGVAKRVEATSAPSLKWLH